MSALPLRSFKREVGTNRHGVKVISPEEAGEPTGRRVEKHAAEISLDLLLEEQQFEVVSNCRPVRSGRSISGQSGRFDMA